jgi:hypothetical protein
MVVKLAGIGRTNEKRPCELDVRRAIVFRGKVSKAFSEIV